ncbi:hypothetical protein [Bacteroides sp.]|uniref:hypothetical protein n=1 Tax=Bacteroides sp. TaxID=29523 RepID=UPI0025C506D2|nr:hypothetical protein [Bacteroides sp.]
MLNINRIRVEILSNKSNDISDLYGFDYSFTSGLNIIAGQNSRGKTTINSCIYYGLGMEELLGGQNDKALDKALKEEFTIISNSNEVDHEIVLSKVYLEISNNKDVKTLFRYIKSRVKEEPNNIIKVFNSGIDTISDDVTEIERLYVNGRGNNENENGFYSWLADFVDLEIPIVSNTSRINNYSPLYLQVIFSTLLIEQTKGWSDFFATMPFFGIPKAKEKNVEFLLGLNELKLSTERDVLSKEKNIIESQWKEILNSLKLIEKEYNGYLSDIPEELTTDHSEIERISIFFKTSQNGRLSLESYLALLEEEYTKLDSAPISKIGSNREALLAEYKEHKTQYYELKIYIENFISKLNVEKYQLSNLRKQLKRIETEIREHESLKKVFKSNILNEKGGHFCPMCTQSVSVDLITDNNLEIPKLGLDENTAFLKSQKKLLEASIKSLTNTIKEKEVILEYFNRNLRQKEEVIKSLSKDLIADDRAFSEADVVKKMQIQREIDNLKFIQSEIKKYKDELINRANKFHNNLISLGGLKESEAIDENIIKAFETYYKELLSLFGYESNPVWKIDISRKHPFKYFPIYKNYAEDKTPQSIRINSSASDFVRNLWAYSISLLIKGVNHPGLLVFDEPGQHRINIQSLKSLFEFCSNITNKQIIIFTSIEKQISDKEKLEIDELITNIKREKIHLIKLDNKNKVIQLLS